MPNENDVGAGKGGEKGKAILGLSTEELAGLSVEELTGNETAIKMLVHYYRVLVDDNSSLRNDLNTAQTYISAYDKKKSRASIGAWLLLSANLSIAVGVNLITSSAYFPGFVTLLPGIALAVLGTNLSLRDE